MKKLTGMIIMAALFLSTCIPAYARPQYSEETKRLMREAGLRTEELEFHTVPKDTPANDGYRFGGFDELHINEKYRQNVWHPEHRGYRINGFDEFRYPDEM